MSSDLNFKIWESFFFFFNRFWKNKLKCCRTEIGKSKLDIQFKNLKSELINKNEQCMVLTLEYEKL